MDNRLLAIFCLIAALSGPLFGAEILHSKVDFEITSKILNSSDIHFSFAEYENDAFSRINISNIDVEQLSRLKNSRIFFTKSVFTINKNIEDLDTSVFTDTKVIKEIMGATSLSRIVNQDNLWNSTIPIYIYNVESQLEVKKVNFNELENDVFMDYYLATDVLDQNLPKSDYQVHIRLTKFNMGFDRMMVVCNFVSIPPKTAIACYVIAKADNSWWKKRNLFGIASKRMKKMITKVLLDTRSILK